jgi:hypothetical protein
MKIIQSLASFLCAAALWGSTATTVSADSPRLTSDDYLNLLRIDLRATKAQILADAMELTAEESTAFWRIYSEYDTELSKLNAKRISLLREFAQCYAAIDDEKAAQLSERSFEFMQRRLDLLQKFSRKIAKATTPIVAARFAQIENHLQMMVDVQIASEFPLIPRRADLAQAGVR